VRAGLALVAAALQTRVGIATGLVGVGDLIGSGEAQERGIVGETPNHAARCVAEPNSVVIAESTRKLVGNIFELEGNRRRQCTSFRPLVKRKSGRRTFDQLTATNKVPYFQQSQNAPWR
jgi:class 3 adenylate cyclase